jgi:nucleoside-diphosphate-sugar epimerase
MKKKVMLITGSSGRIGKECVQRFADEYQVVGFDRKKVEHEKDMDHFQMDMSDEKSVVDALQEVRAKYGNQLGPVIHLAGYYSFDIGQPDLYEQITVQGTKRLLEHLQSFDVEQFIFASTILVNAPCELGQKINEDSPLDPKWDYPKSKVRTEKIIRELRGKIPAVILRIAGCYDDLCHREKRSAPS